MPDYPEYLEEDNNTEAETVSYADLGQHYANVVQQYSVFTPEDQGLIKALMDDGDEDEPPTNAHGQTEEDIDDIIHEWHNHKFGDNVKLHEALGWTVEEYAEWINPPNLIGDTTPGGFIPEGQAETITVEDLIPADSIWGIPGNSSTQIYRTVLTIEIISAGPWYDGTTDDDPFDLERINQAITNGDCIGTVEMVSSDTLSIPDLVELLHKMGNDGKFFDAPE